MNSSVKAITEILQGIGLTHEEGALFMKASLFPGLTPRQLEFQCGFSRMTTYRIIQRLENQEYLIIKKSDQGPKRRVFAIPFDALSKRLTAISGKLLEKATEIDLIHKLTKHHRSEEEFNVEILTEEKAIEDFFGLHDLEWNYNLALGCVEPFLRFVGLDVMKKWPRERAKKGRKAAAVITEIGPYTREIMTYNERDLRQTRYVRELSIPNQYIELIPDQDLTIIFNNNTEDNSWSLTKVRSAPIAKSYESIINSYL